MGKVEYHACDRKETQLQIIIDAKNLHAHTCHIMQNAKIFNPAYDFNGMTLVHIFEATLDVYVKLYNANLIRVGNNPELAKTRLELGQLAQISIDNVLALQELAKTQFKRLGGKPRKFWYWANMAVKLKDKMKAWRKTESERYAEIAKRMFDK